MMTMQPGLDDMTKQRILQAKALCKEVRGGMSRIHDVHGFDIRLKSTSAHNSNTHIRFGPKLANGVLYILVNISFNKCVYMLRRPQFDVVLYMQIPGGPLRKIPQTFAQRSSQFVSSRFSPASPLKSAGCDSRR